MKNKTTTLSSSEVKQAFQSKGLTFTSWANENGYRINDVYRVLNGQLKAKYGTAHEIAVKLGMKEAS